MHINQHHCKCASVCQKANFHLCFLSTDVKLSIKTTVKHTTCETGTQTKNMKQLNGIKSSEEYGKLHAHVHVPLKNIFSHVFNLFSADHRQFIE